MKSATSAPELGKETVERLEGIAGDALKSIFPESFWRDVVAVCDLARAAAFHLSETLPDRPDGPSEHIARKFLARWDGRS
jgi:hypothetical protein